jgi:uncharacterized protein YhdP
MFRWLAHFRVFIIISVAVILITAAVVFSALRAVLPFATGYKQEIQQELSRQLELPVEIESIDAAIHWFSPALRLINVSVYDSDNKAPLFNFDEAFLELDVVTSVLRGEIIVDNIGLIGTDISIEKLTETEWTVQGIRFSSDGDSELPESISYMLLNSDYLFHDCNIYYQDHTGDKLSLQLLDININVINTFNRHDIMMTMLLPDSYGQHLAIVASLEGDIDDFSGDVFIEATDTRVKQWNTKFGLTDDYDMDATLDINAWVDIENARVVDLVSKIEANDVSVRNQHNGRSWKTPHLAGKARVSKNQDRWYISIADLVFGETDNPSWPVPLDLLVIEDQDAWSLSASFLRLTDARQIADVFLDDEQRNSLAIMDNYSLSTDIYNLSMVLPGHIGGQITGRDSEQDGAQGAHKSAIADITFNATLVDAYIQDHENAIAISGIDAEIHYQAGAIDLGVASEDVSIEVADLFRKPLFLQHIDGSIAITRHDEDWRIQTDSLRLSNAHISTRSRFRIDVDDVSGIFVDIQTDFRDAYASNASQYLPVGIMGPGLVEWLDMAIVDGYVPAGAFLLYGPLKRFPYKKDDGVFQVHFEPRDVTLKFLQDWPELVDARGSVRFENESLYIEDMAASTDDIPQLTGMAVIPDLYEAALHVEAGATAANQDLQSYVWNSALDDILGNTLRLFQMQGKSDLSLSLDIPLKADDIDVSLTGKLGFRDAELYYPSLGYELKAINGTLGFTEKSIFADQIKARIDGRDAVIDVLTYDIDDSSQVIFSLAGDMDIDHLAQRFDWIPADWLSGHSKWMFDIMVPYVPKDYQVRISAASDLQGSVIDISDQVSKPAAGELTFTSTIDILENEGLQVKSMLKQGDTELYDLFANRDSELTWNFDIRSGYVTGRGKFNQTLAKDTMVELRLEEIDLFSLFSRAEQRESDPVSPAIFPSMQISADKLHWKHWHLRDVEIDTSWHEHGMLINSLTLSGPAMEFDARGTWLTSWRGVHETVFQAELTGYNCGESLIGLGYERSLDRCDYEAEFNAKWPAEPYRMSWEIMKGTARFHLNDGIITDVDPGAGGRLIGLLNIFKLANRLALDFDDVTKSGFAFDSIQGGFEFVDGKGSLNDVNLTAPAADMNVFGRIGLIEQDYNLLLRVKPNTDSLTFAGGALLGGVTVGAGLALLKKIFDLGGAGYDVYSITGKWDKPVFEQVVQAGDSRNNTGGDFYDDF